MKKVVLVLLIALLVLVPCACKKKTSDNNQPNVIDDVATFDDQTINGIKFQDTVIVYEDGLSTLTMTIINEGTESVNIDTVNIKLYNTNNQLVQEFDSVIGIEVKVGSKVPLVQEIFKDISKTVKIEYKIND